MMNILVCYGTRPEWIKIKPLLKAFNVNNINYKVLFTGQHNSKINADFYYDYSIEINGDDNENRLNSIFNSVLSPKTSIFLNEFSHILIHGDTTTAVACAINAVNNKKKIIHLEAGLRSYDFYNPYPEEYNRCIISRVADIHLCPTIYNKKNLYRENIKKNVFVVGNTLFDNFQSFKNDITYSDKVLITIHRRENIPIIERWFNEINVIANNYKHIDFILPMHPNKEIQKFKSNLNSKNILVKEPLSYNDMINLIKSVKLIISDSGGIQEEASFFKKKCLVCRNSTERPECLNKSSFLIKSPELLFNEFNNHIIDYKINYKSPFGDGFSCDKICNILKTLI